MWELGVFEFVFWFFDFGFYEWVLVVDLEVVEKCGLFL